MEIKNNINTNIYRKKRCRLGVALSKEVREEFKFWCEENKISAQYFLEQAILKVIGWER